MKIWAKEEGIEGEKFLVVRRDGSNPHWPHFVIGARDPVAPEALRAYAEIAERIGMDADYVASVRELADDFYAYRMAHGDGDPDAGPHRVDNPDVIRVMTGYTATITVVPDQGNVAKPEIEEV